MKKGKKKAKATQREKIPDETKLAAVTRLAHGETAGNLAQEYGVTATAIYQWRQKLGPQNVGKLPVAAKGTGSVKRALGRLPVEVQDALTFLKDANDLIGEAWRRGKEPDDAHVAAMNAYRTLMRLLRKGATEE